MDMFFKLNVLTPAGQNLLKLMFGQFWRPDVQEK